MTKAKMLKYLLSSLELSTIDDFISFTIEDWNKDSNLILSQIRKANLGNVLIIRSSAIQEDDKEWTCAGVYQSVLGIPGDDIDLIVSAINKVIDSFHCRMNFNSLNEIIVQRQLLNLQLSGVIFTRDPKTNSPYYTIEYDCSGRTNLVTGSGKRKLIHVLRKMRLKTKYPWSIILPAVQEIEMLMPKKLLDIEFALDNRNIVHIFQVRTLPKRQIYCQEENDRFMKNLLRELSQNFNENFIHNPTMYSNMADWNPAEMLGSRPNRLAISLYRFLITQDTWRKARVKLGYTDLAPRELMVVFAGKPYIDVDASLRSLTPSSLPNDIRDRLIRFQIKKLQKNPHLHDKIEFIIAYSCSDITVPTRTSSLSQCGFSNAEITRIDDSLIDLTQSLFNNIPNLIKESQALLSQLTRERERNNYLWSSKSLNDLFLAINELLNNCKSLGVYPFAYLARLAFIFHDLLRQLLYRKVINKKQYQDFLSSIRTVPSLIRDDLISYKKDQITKEDFLRKYGHLRPGTYDINALRYDQMPQIIFNRMDELSSYNGKGIFFDSKTLSRIEKTLKTVKLDIEGEKFLQIAKQAIEWREKAKLDFTQTLSDIIELIAKMGDLLDFKRIQLANLDIEQIISNENLQKNFYEIHKSWNDSIEKNRQMKKFYDCIILPPLIQSQDDFYFVHFHKSKPNFVTNKIIEAPIVLLDEIMSNYNSNLKEKIIVIEAADPGYDWIFFRGIFGLITKYGGMASHMAIRCSEMGIPAAIGCGEIIYERLKRAKIVRIDANKEKILFIS